LVKTIAINSNNNVYAAGEFTTAGGNAANYVAMWNPSTSTWSALGSGVNAQVNSIDIDSNNNVYIGGFFTIAGGVSANYITKYS